MERASVPFRFSAPLERSTNRLWGAHVTVPDSIATKLTRGGSRRVVCTLNGTGTFQCALIPHGRGRCVVTVNKDLRTKLQLSFGDDVAVALSPDSSSHGHPIAAEWKAALTQDPEGRKHFQSLTLGRQRTLLYIINRAKNSDERIRRSLVILEHLKSTKGRIDYKKLTIQLRTKFRSA